eukprot:178715_1
MSARTNYWLIQAWLFVNQASFWNSITVSEYLNGVPDDAMIILDLATAIQPVYNKYNSDYGGANGIIGNLGVISNGIPSALLFPNTTVSGVGITMEGIWQNYVMYDLTLKMGWSNITIPIEQFIYKYSMRRYGLPHTANNSNMIIDNINAAWSQLANTVYNLSAQVPKSLPLYVPNLFQKYELLYDAMDIQNVWKLYIEIGDGLSNIDQFRYDTLCDQFALKFNEMIHCYHSGRNPNITCVKQNANDLLSILIDLDNVLLTNVNFMLGPWITSARNVSNNTDTRNWMEYNAKN